jgi:hypothetical protein
MSVVTTLDILEVLLCDDEKLSDQVFVGFGRKQQATGSHLGELVNGAFGE